MDAPTDIDALAEALRVDGVVVDRAMGSGESQESHDRIAALVRQVPFPVYVALVEEPEGLPEDGIAATEALAALLNRRLGDGLYVLHTDESFHQVFSFGLDADPDRLSLGGSANKDLLDAAVQDVAGPAGTEDYVYVPPVVEAEGQVMAAEDLLEVARQDPGTDWPATLTREEAGRLAERAVALDSAARWRPERTDHVEVRTASAGLSALVGALSGLVVALLLGQTLRGWPRYGRSRPEPRPAKAPARRSDPPALPPDLETERSRAAELVDALVRALADADWEAVRDRDVAGRALTARDAAEGLLDSRDVGDVVGAQVLARAGSHDLARGRRGSGHPLRTCWFDPRHPAGDRRASWQLGDGEVEVPCCPRCERDLAAGRTPELLRLPTRRGPRPYWERDDVWARTGFGATADFLARDVLAARVGER